MKKFITLSNLIALSIFGLPLYLVKLNIFNLPTNMLDVLEVIVIGWWLWAKKNQIRKGLYPLKKYMFPLGLIFLGLAASILANGNYLKGAGILKSWFLLPLFFSLAAVDTFKEKRKQLFESLLWSAFLTAILALVYAVFGRFTYDGRLEAFFNSPNYLAMYLAPGLIIGLGLVQVQRRTPYLIGCGVIAIALYFTFSYAAWTAIAISLLITEIIKRKNNILRSKIIWSVIILITIVFSAQWNNEKLKALNDFSGRSSLDSRLMIWRSAGKMISDNWLLGIGPGNFQEKYLEYQKFFPPYLEWAVPHPHSILLTSWLYSGIFGLLGFFWLIFVWFRDWLKKTEGELKFMILCVMLYIIVHGLADTTYFKNDLAIVFWLIFFLGATKNFALSEAKQRQ